VEDHAIRRSTLARSCSFPTSVAAIRPIDPPMGDAEGGS
jgi:hypothetical protein